MIQIGAGFINGFLTTKGKIEAFIVTLGTMGIYRSLVTYFADGGTLSLASAARDIYRPVYYDSFLRIPIPVWVFIGVAIIGWILMNRTAFGRSVRAEEMQQGLVFLRAQAEAYGLPVEIWENDPQVWGDYAHVLLNTKEFIYLQ